MKSMIRFALLGLTTLAVSTGAANAGWFHCLSCKSGCYVNVQLKQYNAFSPYCADGIAGGCYSSAFMQSMQMGHGAACASGDACVMGSLPASAEIISHTVTPVKPREAAAGQAAQAAPKQQIPASPSAMITPKAAPGYYPGATQLYPQVGYRR